MSRRTKIIIGIIIALVVILLLIIGILWWLNYVKKKAEPLTNVNEGIQIPTTPSSASAGLPEMTSPVGEPQLEATLKAIAFTFAERFGSYSNQGNFSNLEALRDLMTVKMKAWADNYQATEKVKLAENPRYYGVNTQALSAEITTFDETLGRAEIIVVTQRQEAKGTPANPEVFYQSLKLQIVKTEVGWKVDSAEWQ